VTPESITACSSLASLVEIAAREQFNNCAESSPAHGYAVSIGNTAFALDEFFAGFLPEL